MTATVLPEPVLNVNRAAGPGAEWPLLGCDFSSSPTPKKQIVIAAGRLIGGVVLLQKLECFNSLDDWQQRLQTGPWVGGFDLPFGLPRELVQTFGWPLDWAACVRQFASQHKTDLRLQLKAFCDSRPTGAKFAHRATDQPAGSSPSMKWVNPPVAWMLHAGVPRLMDAGAVFPAHQPWPSVPPERVALEAYPGLLAREVLGRASYKSDDPARQDTPRLMARKTMVNALEQGQTRLGLRLKLTPTQADALVADGSGDSLDAVLCLVQAAWCWQQHLAGHPNWGLPPVVDPLEGWIATA